MKPKENIKPKENKRRNQKRLSFENQLKETVCTVSQPTVGDILDKRYEIKEEQGRGGMGIVYRAFDKELEMEVALKVLPLELASNQKAIQALKTEAKLAMKLNHPSIIGLHHFAHTGPVKYLVMELLSGYTLEEKLNQEEILEPEEVINLVKQLAGALDYAHSKKIVHRDIKPDNIFIHKENEIEEIKLMDFGIARQIKESMTRLTRQDNSGTILYMPPEQMEGKALNGRADIYALGATAYECLAGTPPFYKGSISYQILNKVPEPIDDIPQKINDALMIALAKNPNDRFDTVADFAKALAGEKEPENGDKREPANIDKKPILIKTESEDLKKESENIEKKTENIEKETKISETQIKIWKNPKTFGLFFYGGLLILFGLPTILFLPILTGDSSQFGIGIIELMILLIPAIAMIVIAYHTFQQLSSF